MMERGTDEGEGEGDKDADEEDDTMVDKDAEDVTAAV